MELKHIQSLLALNATNINAKHVQIENLQEAARILKMDSGFVHPSTAILLKCQREGIFKTLTIVRKSLAKAVEVQKALKSEMKFIQEMENSLVGLGFCVE